ncbi:MAG: SGNH/GDSL hydrolase family protein, partial [Alphaproteobacteria bacterium]|nr:SGNH/GDSL hydrolase family protein [Alphaproteobacteria bacterium]
MSRPSRLLVVSGLLVALAICVPAASPARASSLERCDAPSELTRLSGRLFRTGLRIARHEKLTIVAIGSSSTEGVGASTPEATYPSRLAAELRQRLPDQTVSVINKGIGGEISSDEVARFDRDVFPA